MGGLYGEKIFSLASKQGLASPPCFWYRKKYGEVSERFNVLVLKTNVAKVTVGSNPTLSEKSRAAAYTQQCICACLKNTYQESISFLICGTLYDIIKLLVHSLIWSDWRFSHASTFHSWTITGSVRAIWPARGCTSDYSRSFLTACFCLASVCKFPLITEKNTSHVLLFTLLIGESKTVCLR